MREGKLFHIGRIDAADQRLDQPLKDLSSKPADGKMFHRFIFVVLAAGNDVFQSGAQFTERREQRRDGHRPPFCRGHHHETVGEFAEPAAPEDERLPVARRGGHDVGFKPQPTTQIKTIGDRCDEIIDALLDLKTVDEFGVQYTAESIPFFEEGDLRDRAVFPQIKRGGKTGNSPPHDGDSECFRLVWHESVPDDEKK